MKRPFLTVLTTPIAPGTRRVYQQVRRALRPIVKPGVPLPATSQYPGHYAVTRSVVEGLQQIGADFNFNPERMSEVGQVVYAPANEALRQAVEWKRAGVVETLLAGPVNALSPFEEHGLLLAPELDGLIVASEWVRDLYRDSAPQLVAKCRICPCGIDPESWRPTTPASDRAVIYWKSGPESQCANVERLVEAHGFRPVRIRYGSYDGDIYRATLDGAAIAVFLSAFETQGVALAEAWAMNVATLVWNPLAPTDWRGWRFTSGSSAPYLSASTGVFWQSLDDLAAALACAQRRDGRWQPREWVLAHMTDAICARRLFTAIEAVARLPVPQ
jgi:hypothetical protein